MKFNFFYFALLLSPQIAYSQHEHHHHSNSVQEHEISKTSLMFHGNGFLSGISESGPRGRRAFAAPNMLMLNFAKQINETHTFHLNFMGTLERWTFPENGSPLLLQIGEENAQGVKYVDAQHPHSSPIMGLTLSDTIRWNSDISLELFFAPRGESTDGPIAFMHRVTGMVNPDAPLGHHIGQDAGHISSTVVGESLRIGKTKFEASLFHGREPSPSKVDLPLGTLDSFSLRWIYDFHSSFYGMLSFSEIKSPEADEPEAKKVHRYSGSIYNSYSFSNAWTLNNSLIYGAITSYDHISILNSVTEEFLFERNDSRIWSRIEILQRTPLELEIVSEHPNHAQWVSAVTLGYTHRLYTWGSLALSLGASVTRDILPKDYREIYDGNPWTGKLFLQIYEMKTWNL